MRRYREVKTKDDDEALIKWLKKDRVIVSEYLSRNSSRKKNKTKKDGK